MRKRVVAASAAFILVPLSAAVHAAIPVEQIEAYGNPNTDTQYTPVHFAGTSTITLGQFDQGANFPFLNFQALYPTSANYNDLFSGHANAVGRSMYALGTVAYPYVVNASVTDIYCDAYDRFLVNEVQTQDTPGPGPLPGTFASGVKVVNNSYVVGYTTSSANTDASRRIDYMINQQDLTFVAAAVSSDTNGSYALDWSSFNSLAVTGSSQTFNPAGAIGKAHADVYLPGDASFSAGTVSGYTTALYGNAQAAVGQSDAMHSVVNRSLLMAGADKTTYTRQTTNNLDITHGAGTANYDNSLAILQSGEKSILNVNVSNGSVTAPVSAASGAQDGWAYGSINAVGQNVVLFSSTGTITGLTASMNWNVTSPVTGSNINTSTEPLPTLTLEVRPVTYNVSTGQYVVGSNQSNTTLHSTATSDNVQYLYYTSTLAAGTYAFLIKGDSTLSPAVGFSYTLSGSFASQWNSSTGSSWGTAGNWTNSTANGKAAIANFLSAPGLTTPGTITLDGNRTVGVINFNNANGYTIAAGTGGTLTFDDTGDSTGIVNAQINVVAGNHVISAPISAPSTLNFNVAGGSSLLVSGTSSNSNSITKSGAGTLTFGNTTGTLLSRVVFGQIGINGGGTLALATSATPSTRQLLIAASGLSISGGTDNWTSRLDLGNSDLEIYGGGDLTTVTNQVKQGYNNGKWNGSGGISSTAAANDTTHLTALGILLNNQAGGQVLSTFDGATPAAASLFVKYTYYGDANLDGKVDGSDYSRIDNGSLMHLTSWYNGDFNYDGTVNGSDYTLIDNAFNQQGAVIAAAVSTAQIATQVAAVPEPAAIGFIGLSAFALLGRRRVGRRRIENKK